MYKRYQNLLFFDKNGNPINLKYDEDNEVWKGSIHLDEVSIKLFENDTLFMVEVFQDNNSPSFNLLHGVPHIDQAASSTEVTAKIGVDSSDGFNLFSVDNPLNPDPEIELSKEQTLDFIDSPSDTVDPVTDRLVTSNNINEVKRIDVSLGSNEEGVHTGTLTIEDEIGVFIEIELYGEVVGEDERFNTILNNFGESISEREEFIFRESDINEDLPDYKVLNSKRKEFILEMSNITPYYSGYKGIVNIIKFFGYPDLRLKEYWKNVETGKTTLDEVVLNEEDKLNKPNRVLDYPYQKTSFFGLFYDINRVVEGEFTELGLPITEDALIFSNEEIIIKLFGLKNYIRDKGIGGVARIVDIIGEASYFERYSLNTWMDRSELQEIDYQIVPEFESNNTFGYITDVRPILEDFTDCPLDRSLVIEDNPDVRPGNYPNCFIGYFNPFLQDDPEFLDEPEIPVGFPIKLINKSFDLSWEDTSPSWEDTLDVNLTVTWETISHLNFYEVEWIIKKVRTPDDDRKYENILRGTVSNMKEVSVILPYDGLYDVTLVLHGWYNNISKSTKKSYIEVKLREADFANFFRILDPNLQNWENNYLTWENVHSEWKNPIYENETFLIDEDKVRTDTYHIVNFVQTDVLNIPHVGINPPPWRDFEDSRSRWRDFGYVTFDHLIHEREKLARFAIEKINAGGKIQIGEDIVEIPQDYNIHDYRKLADFLRSLTGDDVSTFEYTARTVDQSKVSSFIDCVSTIQGENGDRWVGSSGGAEIEIHGDNEYESWNEIEDSWDKVPITWENFERAGKTKAIENPFTMDNIQIFNSSFEVPLAVSVFFVVDNSFIPGKSGVRWKITNMDSGEVVVDTDQSMTLVYRFVKPGNYTVEVTIEDTNGNTNTIVKEGHVRVKNPSQYGNNLLIENVFSKEGQPTPPEPEFV